MSPTKEVARTPVCFHACNHLCAQKGKLLGSHHYAKIIYFHPLSVFHTLPLLIRPSQMVFTHAVNQISLGFTFKQSIIVCLHTDALLCTHKHTLV